METCEKIIDHFERYRESQAVWESGGKLYLTEEAAQSYGDGTVTKYTREWAERTKQNAAVAAKPKPKRK